MQVCRVWKIPQIPKLKLLKNVKSTLAPSTPARVASLEKPVFQNDSHCQFSLHIPYRINMFSCYWEAKGSSTSPSLTAFSAYGDSSSDW